MPAAAADRRPYDGPEEIEAAPRDPVELREPDAPVRVPAIDDDVGDEDSPDDGALEDDAEDFASAVADGPRDWRDEPEGEVATRRIRGGVLLTSGGAVLVIGAIIFGAVDPCKRLTGNGCQKAASRRAALTMGIPGAVILAAGATMLALGLKTRRILQRNVLVGPELGRHGAGLSIVGRF